MKRSRCLILVVAMVIATAMLMVSCEKSPLDETSANKIVESTESSGTHVSGDESADKGATESSESVTTEKTGEPDATEHEGTQSETSDDTADSVNTGENVTVETSTQSQDTVETTFACEHQWSQYVEADGGHTRSCDKCGEKQSEDHVADTKYSSDAESHWFACTLCDAKLQGQAHSETLENTNDKKHTVFCEICGCVIDNVSHVFVAVTSGERHECACGANQTCPAIVMDWLYNDADHWKTACEICNISDGRVEHNWFFKYKERVCLDCEYTQTCDDDHLGFDGECHWIEEDCEICRISIDGERFQHNGITMRITRGETSDTYSRTCSKCRYAYQTWNVPKCANYYSVPGQFMNNWNSGSMGGSENVAVGEIRTDGDKPYARITLLAGASFEFANSTYVIGFAADEPINGGSGRFAIVKLRAHNVSFISLALNTNTSSVANENFNPGVGPHRNDRVSSNIINDQWITYVIDLAHLNAPNYKANDTNVTAISFGMFFNGHNADGSAYIDIEYAAICDNWTEVKEIVGEGNKVLYTDWVSKDRDSLRKSDGNYLDACIGECTPKLEIEGNAYVYRCSSCNAVIETRTVDVGENGINYYSAASFSQALNNWNTGGNVSRGSYSGQLKIYENSFVYNRITLQNGGSFEFTNGTSEPTKGFGRVDDTIYGSGSYMVIKMRVGSTEEAIKLCAWDGRTEGRGGDPIFDSHSHSTHRTMTAENREWAVYVIEISAVFAQTDYATDDDTVTRAVFGIKGDSTGTATATDDGSNDYIDIAYFAICDDWTEVAKVAAGEDKVIFTGWSDAVGYNEYRKPDGTAYE